MHSSKNWRYFTTCIDRHCQCPFRNCLHDYVHASPANEAVWKYSPLCYKSRQCRRQCKPGSPTAREEPSWTIQHAHLDSQSFLEQSRASSLYTLAWQRWLYCAPKHCSPLGNGRSQCNPRRWRCWWQCWVRCASRFCKIREAGDKRNLIIDYRSNKEKRCLKGLSHAYRRRIINATVPYSGRQTKWQSGQGYCKLPVSKTMSTMYSEMR